MQNEHLEKLTGNYLFAEIAKRVEAHPGPHINLGIGDTSHALPPSITERMAAYASSLATTEGYQGYGPAAGRADLRELISERFYRGKISPDEIFISDGAKPDLSRLQYLFREGLHVAIQDPAYPVYLETSLLRGHQITLMPCTPENDFFPTHFPEADLFFICSPNNPTGTVATPTQLQSLIDHAQKTNAAILFDAAYASFIGHPYSIFDIEGGKEIAIETGSFSKLAGFTGIRLGWTVVPKGRFHKAWRRLNATLFNGASLISQEGGAACLEEKGWTDLQQIANYYLENARLLKEALPVPSYGGEKAPYIWAHFGGASWEAFDKLLSQGLITTPGIGYGPSGEGFLRLSSLGSREDILHATQLFKEVFVAEV